MGGWAGLDEIDGEGPDHHPDITTAGDNVGRQCSGCSSEMWHDVTASLLPGYCSLRSIAVLATSNWPHPGVLPRSHATQAGGQSGLDKERYCLHGGDGASHCTGGVGPLGIPPLHAPLGTPVSMGPC